MANSNLELVALCLTLVGFIMAVASTGMPMWRVTAFIGENIIVFETRYEGLWMNCFRQANIRMQCKVYDSLLALSSDLQAARGLMCCSLALGGLGLLISIVGMQCTACIRNDDRSKRVIRIIAGSMIIGSCVCVIIPVSWTGHAIIRDFYNPLLIDAQRRELGEALYIGWAASAFLFAGGCIFTCCSISQDKGSEMDMYSGDSQYMSYPPQPQSQPQPLIQPWSFIHPQPRIHPQSFIQPQTLQRQVQRQPSIYSYRPRYPSLRSAVSYL